jgi:hypothetical protein
VLLFLDNKMANPLEVLQSENGLRELHEKLRLPDDEFEE